MRIQGTYARAALVASLAAGFCVPQTAAQTRGKLPFAPPTQSSSHWRDASLDDYRNHLTALNALVEACAKARDLKNCDPTLVGPDDRIPLPGAAAGSRLVRYGWLRVLFSKAEEPDQAVPKPAPGARNAPDQSSDQPPTQTTSQLLQDAKERLALDLAQTNVAPQSASAHVQERDSMLQVLAGRDFRDLQQPSVRQTMMEKVSNWLNQIFASVARLRPRSPWLGRAIVWIFILLVCTGLAWGLLQLERRWRLRLVPEATGSDSSFASARDWQFWLQDARHAATTGQWREAIHCVYWASISRLESQRLWPADRARTPREYLALVAPEDPRKPGLANLTGRFERTWYGGRAAGESEFRRAEQLATGLIAGGAALDDAGTSGTPNSGAA